MRITPRSFAHIASITAILIGSVLTGTQPVWGAYAPPNSITVTMYVLTATGARDFPYKLCVQNDNRFGCTVSSALGLYPFGSSNPVAVQIEGTATNNRYLRDVLPREMGPAAYDPLALRAQAVAARTYAFWHIQAGSTINNSTEFQAFVPRHYDSLSATDKGRVDTALATPRYYMSYYTSFNNGFRTVAADEPIFSEFSADAYLNTVTHPEQNPRHPYLLGVQDPISYDPAIPGIVSSTGAHQRGMSQNGAGRWARGSSSYREGFGTSWSVKLTGANRILTHYYTGVHLRDVASPTTLATPPNRWIPLRIGWGTANGAPPGFLCQNWNYRLTVRVQNTGTSNWTAGEVRLEVTNSSPPAVVLIPASVSRGGVYTATVTATTPSNFSSSQFSFSLDMKMNGTRFSAQTPTWAAYTLGPITAINCKFFYVPRLDQEGPPVAGE